MDGLCTVVANVRIHTMESSALQLKRKDPFFAIHATTRVELRSNVMRNQATTRQGPPAPRRQSRMLSSRTRRVSQSSSGQSTRPLLAPHQSATRPYAWALLAPCWSPPVTPARQPARSGDSPPSNAKTPLFCQGDLVDLDKYGQSCGGRAYITKLEWTPGGSTVYKASYVVDAGKTTPK
jgi:hypothetical protein